MCVYVYVYMCVCVEDARETTRADSGCFVLWELSILPGYLPETLNAVLSFNIKLDTLQKKLLLNAWAFILHGCDSKLGLQWVLTPATVGIGSVLGGVWCNHRSGGIWKHFTALSQPVHLDPDKASVLIAD